MWVCLFVTNKTLSIVKTKKKVIPLNVQHGIILHDVVVTGILSLSLVFFPLYFRSQTVRKANKETN